MAASKLLAHRLILHECGYCKLYPGYFASLPIHKESDRAFLLGFEESVILRRSS